MFVIAWRGKFYNKGQWVADEKGAQVFSDISECFALARQYVTAEVYSVGDDR